jgi:hypothetical protein
MEELKDHTDLKVSMDYGDDQWIGYNETSKNMYVVLDLPTHLIGAYSSLCLVARTQCGGAVIHYVATTDEDCKEETFYVYDELMYDFDEQKRHPDYECNTCFTKGETPYGKSENCCRECREYFTDQAEQKRKLGNNIEDYDEPREEEIDHADVYAEQCKDELLYSTTIIDGIICNDCNNELPQMTMKDHLDGNFNQKCPHDEPKKKEPWRLPKDKYLDFNMVECLRFVMREQKDEPKRIFH